MAIGSINSGVTAARPRPVEAAAAFIPGGPWPRDADRLEHELMELTDAAFERGREAGRSLSLEEAATLVRDRD